MGLSFCFTNEKVLNNQRQFYASLSTFLLYILENLPTFASESGSFLSDISSLL